MCVKSESPGLDELTRKQKRDNCFLQFNSMVVVNSRAGGSFRFRVVVLLYDRVVSSGLQFDLWAIRHGSPLVCLQIHGRFACTSATYDNLMFFFFFSRLS